MINCTILPDAEELASLDPALTVLRNLKALCAGDVKSNDILQAVDEGVPHLTLGAFWSFEAKNWRSGELTLQVVEIIFRTAASYGKRRGGLIDARLSCYAERADDALSRRQRFAKQTGQQVLRMTGRDSQRLLESHAAAARPEPRASLAAASPAPALGSASR